MSRVLSSLAIALALLIVGASTRGLAQQPGNEGVVRGRVTMASAGASLEGVVEVELIIFDGQQAAGRVKAPVRDGAYEARLPASATRVYVPRINYERVDYFVDPVRFNGTERAATRDFTVYATTDRADMLQLIQTIVTVIAVDREAGEIGVLREDVVAITGDRIFAGGTSGITLRIPAPDGTIEATEEEGRGILANGVLAVTTPVRPGEASSIITSYIVKYDPARDRYRLRVTVPVPAESVVARVPRDFVRGVRPVAPAEQADDQVLQDEARTVLHVVRTTARIEAGQSLLMDIDGVAGTLNHHPLTEQPGASIAAAAVIAGVTALGVLIWRRREAGA